LPHRQGGEKLYILVVVDHYSLKKQIFYFFKLQFFTTQFLNNLCFVILN
jgi:hypothetical protein